MTDASTPTPAATPAPTAAPIPQERLAKPLSLAAPGGGDLLEAAAFAGHIVEMLADNLSCDMDGGLTLNSLAV